MATVHRLPPHPPARDGSGTSPRATDYRAAVERLLAAGVTGSAAIAAALNAEPLYTPPGTAWDGAAVERLLGFLRLRPSGRAAAAAGGARPSSFPRAEPPPAALRRARAGRA
jgi:hypothetical protein